MKIYFISYVYNSIYGYNTFYSAVKHLHPFTQVAQFNKEEKEQKNAGNYCLINWKEISMEDMDELAKSETI